MTALGNTKLLERVSSGLVAMRNLFSQFDVNKDNNITRKEFASVRSPCALCAMGTPPRLCQLHGRHGAAPWLRALLRPCSGREGALWRCCVLHAAGGESRAVLEVRLKVKLTGCSAKQAGHEHKRVYVHSRRIAEMQRQSVHAVSVQVYTELFTDATPERLEALFKYLDRDNTGVVDFLSWSRGLRLQDVPQVGPPAEALWPAPTAAC